jgi:hypothetical protein
MCIGRAVKGWDWRAFSVLGEPSVAKEVALLSARPSLPF